MQDICSELNGFLKSFSLLNCQVNEGYTFAIEALPSIGSVEDDLNAYYQALFNGTEKVENANLKQLPFSVELFCQHVFERWLIVYLKGFTQEQLGPCLDALIGYITQLDIKTVHEALIMPPEHLFYEASWQDFALASKNRTYLLHLGVSD